MICGIPQKKKFWRKFFSRHSFNRKTAAKPASRTYGHFELPKGFSFREIDLYSLSVRSKKSNVSFQASAASDGR